MVLDCSNNSCEHEHLSSVATVQRTMTNLSLRNPVSGSEVKGVLEADSLDSRNIYLRVYSQINFISQHSHHSPGRKCGIHPGINVKFVQFSN